MKAIFQKQWIIGLVLVYLLNGCMSEVESKDSLSQPQYLDMSFRFDVKEMEGELATRANEPPLPGELPATGEKSIKNLTVVQFNGSGNKDDQSVVVRVFNEQIQDGFQVGLMRPYTSETSQYIYFIANVGTELDAFTGTLGDLQKRLITLSHVDALSGGVLMTGAVKTTINEVNAITVSMKPILAKIRFTYTLGLPAGDTFEPTWLQLYNIRKQAQIEMDANLSGPFPLTPDAADYQTSLPVYDQVEKGYAWYIPENYRGTNSNTDQKLKIGKDAYCTYLELQGVYTQKGGVRKQVYYRFYIGENNTNDYNIKRNRVYQLSMILKGFSSADKRVTVEDMPALQSGANCYMVAPGNILTFDPFLPAGVDVANTGITYAGQLGTKAAPAFDRIAIIWQTAPDLIKEMYYVLSTKTVKIQTQAAKSGNALIAAYKGTEIRWSWHIWVSGYKPDDTPDADNKVTGGAIQLFNNTNWMDRDLGGTSATPGNVAAVGMHYQWGRKDPFTPVNAFSGSYHLIDLYDGAGTNVGSLTSTQRAGAQTDFLSPLQNPLLVFNPYSNSYWFGGSHSTTWKDSFAKLWDIGAKTVFDPCPAGWIVPGTSAFNGSSFGDKYDYRYDANVYGVYLNSDKGGTVYWPFGGYKNVTSGTTSGVGVQGVYWASETKSGGSQTAYMANIMPGRYESPPDHGGASRGYSEGFSVRCVKIK